MKRSRQVSASIALTGAAAILTACGSNTATAPAAASPTSASTTSTMKSTQPSTSSPQPVATESNPPGDIPDNTLYVTYTPKSGGYSVKVPEGWARRTTANTATFTDKLNSIATNVYAASKPPTTASAKATNVPALQAAVPQFQLQGVTTFTRSGGSGVLITYQADSKPDPVTNKVIRDAVEQYLFWHNGREVSLTLTGPINADNVDPWMTVSDSFQWRK